MWSVYSYTYNIFVFKYGVCQCVRWCGLELCVIYRLVDRSIISQSEWDTVYGFLDCQVNDDVKFIFPTVVKVSIL